MALTYRTNFIFGEIIKSADLNDNFTIIEDQDVWNEDHTVDINGVLEEFTMTHNFKSGTTRVYVDGVRQLINYDYQEIASNKIKTTGVPNSHILVLGQDLVIDYRRSDI